MPHEELSLVCHPWDGEGTPIPDCPRYGLRHNAQRAAARELLSQPSCHRSEETAAEARRAQGQIPAQLPQADLELPQMLVPDALHVGVTE